MPVRVQCPNPDCQVSFSILEGEASRFRRCPQCGWELSGLGSPDPNRPGSAHSPQPGSTSGSPLLSGLAPGTTFAGRYEIVRQIGRGGMGIVYLARDKRLERQVALKLPFLWGDEDPEFLHRFYREAKAAAGLRHPSICRVYDVGAHDGQPYLTMEYLEGVLLSDHLKKRLNPMDPGDAIRLVRKLARVMQAAHEQGIVHRDLKPANIMLDLEAGPIVMDFGLARRQDREESLRTRAGQQIGTPAYMSLEQFQGKADAIGPRSDVYSLGVILFELLTGKRPYEGNAFEIHIKLLTAGPPAPSSFQRELDTTLDWICQKAMAREIEARYASMAELAAALGAALKAAEANLSIAPAQVPSPIGQASTAPASELTLKSTGAVPSPGPPSRHAPPKSPGPERNLAPIDTRKARTRKRSLVSPPAPGDSGPPSSNIVAGGRPPGEHLRALPLSHRLVIGSLAFVIFRAIVLIAGLFARAVSTSGAAQPRLGPIALAMAAVGSVAGAAWATRTGDGKDIAYGGFTGSILGLYTAAVGFALLACSDSLLGSYSGSLLASLLFWGMLGVAFALFSWFAWPPADLGRIPPERAP